MNLKPIVTAIICLATLSATAQTDTAKRAKKYADNVLAAAPIQVSENGVIGFGISYERVIDKDGILSLYLPVNLVFSSTSEERLGSDAHYNDPMFYVMPGIKLYPTGSKGLAKYAVGPSLVIADGSRTERNNYTYIYGVPSTYYITHDHFIFGMMVNQSLNINPTPHLYVGFEFGFGFSYINRMDGENQTMTGLVQSGFKMGYRF